MKPEDESPTPEELREAEALARALEGDAQAAPPADLRATVGLLRQGREASLTRDRFEAIRARVAPAVLPAARPRRRWPWVAAPLAAAAAMGVLLLIGRRPPSPALALPPPPAPLLAAQAAAARGDGQALGTLDQQMRAYRASMFRRISGGAR